MPSLRTMRREQKDLVEKMRMWALNVVYAPVRWAWEIDASEFHVGIDMGRLRERVKTASDCGWRSELYVTDAGGIGLKHVKQPTAAPDELGV